MGKSRIRIVINDAEGLKLKRKVNIEDLQLEIKALKKMYDCKFKIYQSELNNMAINIKSKIEILKEMKGGSNNGR